jgi:ribosomal protein S18 acetylase RimI-like enzyme
LSSRQVPLLYIDKLQHENADDLAFYPLATLEAAMESGHILSCFENGEPAGYLWHGPVRSGRDVTIYQACIDYDLRRQRLGHEIVSQLLASAKIAAATGVRLRCASSSEANRFWSAIGFYCTAVTNGGRKRGRQINHYRTDIAPTLFVLHPVIAGTRPIDLTTYNREKAAGVQMASRFSRRHYGGGT